MTERDKRLKDELKRLSDFLENTAESARTLLALLEEEPSIIGVLYIHNLRPRLNRLLPKHELDAVQKDLNKIRDLFKSDD